MFTSWMKKWFYDKQPLTIFEPIYVDFRERQRKIFAK